MTLKIGLAGLALSLASFTGAYADISDNVVKIGVLNDISGIFQDTNGMGSVEAARMAADDFAGGGKGIKVEVVYADHQNKADVGSSIVRRWLDLDHVDAIVDVTYLPEAAARRGDFAEILGETIGIDELGRNSGTIGYEILTRLGQRYARRYVGE